jgi:hypothetical protein
VAGHKAICGHLALKNLVALSLKGCVGVVPREVVAGELYKVIHVVPRSVEIILSKNGVDGLPVSSQGINRPFEVV